MIPAVIYFVILAAIGIFLLARGFQPAPQLIGTWVGTTLGFLSSLIVTNYSKSQDQKKSEREKKANRKRQIEVLISEVDRNLSLCKELREYLQNIWHLSDSNFDQRENDPLFKRFLLDLRSEAPQLVSDELKDVALAVKIGDLYELFRHGNVLLDMVTTFLVQRLADALSGQTPLMKYRQALDNPSWRRQLDKVLASIEAKAGTAKAELEEQFSRKL